MQHNATPWYEDPNGPTEKEKNCALGIHLGVLAGVTVLPIIGVVVSLVLWLALRGKSEFINRHGWSMANLVMSLMIYVLILSAIIFGAGAYAAGAAEDGDRSGGVIFILLSIASYGIAVLLWLFNLIGSIMGAVRASDGKPHRYFHALPLIVPS